MGGWCEYLTDVPVVGDISKSIVDWVLDPFGFGVETNIIQFGPQALIDYCEHNPDMCALGPPSAGAIGSWLLEGGFTEEELIKYFDVPSGFEYYGTEWLATTGEIEVKHLTPIEEVYHEQGSVTKTSIQYLKDLLGIGEWDWPDLDAIKWPLLLLIGLFALGGGYALTKR